MLTNADNATLSHKGITVEQLQAQLDRFATGFPYLRIASSAQVGKGITALNKEQEEQAIARWKKFLSDGGHVTKFVPASGAASRMFKALFSYVESNEAVPAEGSPVEKLIAQIEKVPFYAELDATLQRIHEKTLKEMLNEQRYHDIIDAIISSNGMNYGNLPKGLLTFHRYDKATRTPLEEQLVEGAQSAASNGVVRLHFTVSTDHRKLFEKKLAEVVPALEKELGVKYEVSLSEQKPSTDTVAVNLDNTPFRENGQLVFRPGGHGALISNLGDIDSDVVFIKNIDNVVPDSRRDATIYYKTVLAGYLIEVHDSIEKYLKMLNSGRYTIDDLREMIAFMHDVLNIRHDGMKKLEDAELALYIKAKLDRPVRVCGMVRNEGEPGGGPFIAYNPDGSTSPQILESHQIDPNNAEYAAMLASATHFNPVDLVCYIRDINGKPYDLPKYVDPATGFISQKSLHGKDLRALELPGLWNGAMSDWNTIFIEVPAETFNPVKTVNDLLRPAHQQA
jgi:hypothetical protein